MQVGLEERGVDGELGHHVVRVALACDQHRCVVWFLRHRTTSALKSHRPSVLNASQKGTRYDPAMYKKGTHRRSSRVKAVRGPQLPRWNRARSNASHPESAAPAVVGSWLRGRGST